MLLISVILLIAGFYVGWNMGANDAANCIGTTVGAGIISYHRAVLLMSIFALAGAVLQGHHVMKTIGKGIVLCDPSSYASPERIADLEKTNKQLDSPDAADTDDYHELIEKRTRLEAEIDAEIEAGKPAGHEELFPAGRLPDFAIFVALISAGLFVTLATFSSIPVSTSQAIVGGVLGVGLGITGFNSEFFNLGVLTRIFGSWIICPFLTMLLSLVLFYFLRLFLRKIKSGVKMHRTIAFLVVLSSCYVAYSLGMNNVGNAVGPLLCKFPDQGILLAAFCGIALGVGAITFGKRVTATVGKKITPLDPPSALAAQVSAASGLYFFSMMGIPVSTSQAVVGAVIGVGLVRGAKAVSHGKILEIAVGWVASPVFAAIFAAVTFKAALYFFPKPF